MDLEKIAKMSALKKLKAKHKGEDLHGLGEKLKGNLKKVTIASDSPEGMKKGLSLVERMLEARGKSKESDKIEKMMPDIEDMMDSEEDVELDEDEESSDDAEEELPLDLESMSREELIALLKQKSEAKEDDGIKE